VKSKKFPEKSARPDQHAGQPKEMACGDGMLVAPGTIGDPREDSHMLRTLERLRAEFLEMPGLRLTAPQVERLCGVDPTMCRALLDALVDAKFLRQSPDGVYTRVTDGEILRSRPAKAVRAESQEPRHRETA
jgi:hypothetical protein